MALELVAREHGALPPQLERATRRASAHCQPGRDAGRPPPQDLSRLPGQQTRTRRRQVLHGLGPPAASDSHWPESPAQRTERQLGPTAAGFHRPTTSATPGPRTCHCKALADTCAARALPRLSHVDWTGSGPGSGRGRRGRRGGRAGPGRGRPERMGRGGGPSPVAAGGGSGGG